MTIRHHADDATLMSYAAGSLPEALAAVLAAHLALCSRCRLEVAGLERIGAVLFDRIPPVPMLEPAPPVGPAERARARSRLHRAAMFPLPSVP